MRRRAHLLRIVAGLGSTLVIVGLLIGIPVALLALAGSPIPADIPSWQAVVDTLGSGGISDGLLVDIVAVVGWIAWLQVATSAVIEVVAWGRGRPATRLRLAGPAQPVIRELIATAALLLSSSNASVHASTLPAHQVVAIAAALDTAPSATLVGDGHQLAADEGPSSAANNNPIPYTVVRYDTLWGLAETHLGDPLRWPQLYAINQGRPQPDGGVLCEPDLIRPGWTLLFPADAAGLPHEITPARQPVPDPAPVPAAPTPTETEALNAPLPATASTDPPSSPASTSAATPSTDASAPAPDAPTPPSTDPSADEPDAAHRQTPWPLIGAGLAAAGLVALLNRLRRAQQRHRPRGARPPSPRPDLEEIERRLRHLADLDAAERLDIALRALSAGFALTHPVPNVLAVRNGAQHVEVLLDANPPAPPKGFVVTDHERGWITDPDLGTDELRALAAGAAAPLPAIVSLGTIDDEDLLIDLETAGLLTVAGNDADGILRSIITQLATATWIDHVDLLVVDPASTTDAPGADRTRRTTDLDTAIRELQSVARSMNHALGAAEASSTLEARFSEHEADGWIPTVLVSLHPANAEQLAVLAAIVGHGRRGIAVVVPSTTQGRWHVDAAGGQLHLAPLGLSFESSLIDPDIAIALGELLTDAAVSEGFIEPQTDGDGPGSAPVGPYADPTYDIEVRVLGPVEIHGIPSPLQRRRAEELIAYLALHPKGASDDRIKTVLWREHAPTTPTFNTTVSLARTALGRAPDGNFHLPHYSATDRLYRLSPAVTTDLARLEARLAHAQLCPPELATETLRSALELVRGLPFEGARGYEWAYSEHLVAHAEAAISDVANRLADLYLEAGDHRAATWAALQGLKGCPVDEGLYRTRMRACHQAGNLAGAETAFQELCEAVDALEPYDCLQRETLELRRAVGPR